MSTRRVSTLVITLALSLPVLAQNNPNYDISTLAGKVASLHGTAGLQIRFSAFTEEEADASDMISRQPAL